MNDETKEIVAGLLTVAYYANREPEKAEKPFAPPGQNPDEKAKAEVREAEKPLRHIQKTYESFLKLLS